MAGLIEDDVDIKIVLTVEQWNAILDMLSDQPVKRALQLINAIVAQAKEQMPENGLEAPAASVNGAVLKD